MKMLQWGHALSGMDIALGGSVAVAANKRFNGAMPFQAWIYASWGEPRTISGKLQWGHALSGMDTRSKIPFGKLRPKLQWGHALSGMDTKWKCRQCDRRGRLASMGPCPFRHGYQMEVSAM